MSGPVLRQAVIAIGSNSTRMLCANLDPALSDAVRGRIETQLFLSLSEGMEIGDGALAVLCQAVESLRLQALAAGAEKITLMATCAMRESANNSKAFDTLLKCCGLPLQIISGEQEARLSFLGAASAVPEKETLGVLDIGGGSAEIAIGGLQGALDAQSLPIGASRLYRQCPIEGLESLKTAMGLVKGILDSGYRKGPALPSDWMLVGGTGTALAGVLRGSFYPPEDPPYPVTLKEAEDTLRRLALLSPKERALLPGLPPGREHIFPTGLCALVVLMHALEIPQIKISARNNTDGYLYCLMKGLPI